MHSKLEGWLAGRTAVWEKGHEKWRMTWWSGFVGMLRSHRAKPGLPALLADGNITYRRSSRGLKGEVESVVNMWLHTAIPRPASPPLHHLSVRIIEQHITCSRCSVLSCSVIANKAKGSTAMFGGQEKLWIDSWTAAAAAALTRSFAWRELTLLLLK